MTNATTGSEYAAGWTKSGTCEIIRAENVNKPHVYVTWYDGGSYISATLPADQAESYRPNANMRSVRPIEWREPPHVCD